MCKATKCKNCGSDLSIFNTAWAAEGAMYCTKECGLKAFTAKYGNNSEQYFNDVAEEVSTEDIGIIKTELFAAYSEACDLTTIFMDTYRCCDNALVSTEVVGFYYGMPNETDTEHFVGSLKAISWEV